MNLQNKSEVAHWHLINATKIPQSIHYSASNSNYNNYFSIPMCNIVCSKDLISTKYLSLHLQLSMGSSLDSWSRISRIKGRGPCQILGNFFNFVKNFIAIKSFDIVGDDGSRDLWSRGGPLRTALNLKNCDFVIAVLMSLSPLVNCSSQMHWTWPFATSHKILNRIHFL